jgi:vesicular inhibitory amino acid transporter
MLKSLRKILSLQLKDCIKKRSEHGTNLVAVQLPNCNVCVEENKQCNCDNIMVEDRKNISAVEGANVDAEHDANADSSFVHAVINMVGMLIGIFCILLMYL